MFPGKGNSLVNMIFLFFISPFLVFVLSVLLCLSFASRLQRFIRADNWRALFQNSLVPLFGIVFGGLSEFWKSSFLSPPNTIPKSGMTGFWNLALQLKSFTAIMYDVVWTWKVNSNVVRFHTAMTVKHSQYCKAPYYSAVLCGFWLFLIFFNKRVTNITQCWRHRYTSHKHTDVTSIKCFGYFWSVHIRRRR